MTMSFELGPQRGQWIEQYGAEPQLGLRQARIRESGAGAPGLPRSHRRTSSLPPHSRGRLRQSKCCSKKTVWAQWPGHDPWSQTK